MGFADLKNDAVGAFDNALSAFGLGNATLKYPDKYAYVTNVIDENDKSWKKSLGYGFSVVRVSKSGKQEPAEGWEDFILQINPTELSQDEVFAIQVTPTFSGVLVEHQGVTLKDIVIAGTTGISPKRGAGGAFFNTGRPVAGAGRSGYMEFHELRNYFRAYVEQKRVDTDTSKGELRLVWHNYKDKEYIFIEPQKFTMKRQARRPFLYDYSIAMKGIGLATFTPKAGGWLEAIDDFIEDANGYMESGVKIMQGAVGFLQKVEKEIVSTIITPLNTYNQFLQETKNMKAAVIASKGTMSKLSLNNLKAKATLTKNNVYDLMLGDQIKDYNNAIGKVATQKQEKAQPTSDEIKAVKGLDYAIAAINLMTQQAISYEQTVADAKQVANKAYADSKANKIKSASKQVLGKLEQELIAAQKSNNAVLAAAKLKDIEDAKSAAAASVAKLQSEAAIDVSKASSKPVSIGADETIQMIAAKELGSPDAFKELVLLNNLKPPYIDLDLNSPKVPGVLKPGDQILIPSAAGVASLSNIVKNGDFPINKFLSPAEKNLGTDIVLNDDFDIEVGPNNDLKLVASVENFVQSILLKLLIEKGSLKRHREIGTNLNTGTKTTSQNLLMSDVRATLNSDPRVDAVIYSDIKVEGNTYFINLLLKLKDYDQQIALPLKLPAAA